MKIGSGEEYIILEELERNPVGTPCAGDAKVRVSLCFQEFFGSYDGVWFESSQIEKFSSELAFLTDGIGRAKISSLSREEFTLELRSFDYLGHLEIKVELHRYQNSGLKSYPIYLRGGFEIQSEHVSRLKKYFEALAH